MKRHSLFELMRRAPGEAAQSHRDRQWLLSAILNKSIGELFLQRDYFLSAVEQRNYENFCRRRKKGEPLQYIVGFGEFWGRQFLVNKNVLIPRPETERLVEIVLDRLGNAPTRILDIGTGSGAIAVTMALERPQWTVTGSDISQSALTVAKKNAQHLGATVNFVKANILGSPLRIENYDWIVSNPPYLEFKRDFISREVRKNEPRLALEPSISMRLKDSTDRASWIAERLLRVCAEAKGKRPKGVFLELSPRVAFAQERRWRKNPQVLNIERVADLTGRKRFLLIVWKNQESK